MWPAVAALYLLHAVNPTGIIQDALAQDGLPESMCADIPISDPTSALHDPHQNYCQKMSKKKT